LLVALAAPLDVKGREEDDLALGACFEDALKERTRRLGRLTRGVAAAGEDEGFHACTRLSRKGRRTRPT